MLPAPKDKFILLLRLYWPSEKNPSIIDGTWRRALPGEREREKGKEIKGRGSINHRLIDGNQPPHSPPLPHNLLSGVLCCALHVQIAPIGIGGATAACFKSLALNGTSLGDRGAKTGHKKEGGNAPQKGFPASWLPSNENAFGNSPVFKNEIVLRGVAPAPEINRKQDP